MAHHLAALITEAEAANGDAKAVAETRAADLILRLWERRRDLHEAGDPLGPCRDAVEVLSRLRAERNPWLAHRGRGGPEGLLANMFDNMARVVVGGILLTQAGKLREMAPAEEAALSPEEVALREQLAWWEAAVTPEIPDNLKALLRIRFVAAAGASGQDGGQEASTDLGKAGSVPGDAADKSPPTSDEAQYEFLGEPEEVPPKTRRPREQVTEALERLQAEFARLVDAWKDGPGRA
ncbi:hypothetical protein [Limobrevibacterium gyesilva]|uniref:Uncharacterized protein n=1 Tax=Limobrevibacterium gyesilva TaxID=2991712 RepID=A0AA41YRV1_9PROT|nr:hypothetical protein [Limobrevibacterium gyesilva]MCW3477551.1 hypothetical protein [Limobrevibacterium gyesilva]